MQWIVQSDKVNAGSWMRICVSLCFCVGELEQADSEPSLNGRQGKANIFNQNNTSARLSNFYEKLMKLKYTNYVDSNKARHEFSKIRRAKQ